ncbi:VacJ family lipoprotein, partial [Pseudomonas syringae]
MPVTGAGFIKRLVHLSLCAGIALVPVAVQAAEDDPWEGINRSMFTSNDTRDAYTLKPLATGRQYTPPTFAQD